MGRGQGTGGDVERDPSRETATYDYVELIYTADVVVTVRLDPDDPGNDCVLRVQVDDEGARAPKPLNEAEEKALSVTEDSQVFWPAWEFGLF